MPLIITPYLWSKFSRLYYFNFKTKRRIQNDEIEFDLDLIDGYEEVLWRTFKNDFVKNYENTIYKLQITKKAFSKYYIAKNNNNIQRIDYILNTIKNSKVIIPIRNPLKACVSATKVDKIFTEEAIINPYIYYELNFLSHFEFGKFKKYSSIFSENQIKVILNKRNRSTINGYLYEWYFMHKYIQSKIKSYKDIVILPIDKISDKKILGNLLNKLDIYKFDLDNIYSKANYKSISDKKIDISYEKDIYIKCINLYEELVKL